MAGLKKRYTHKAFHRMLRDLHSPQHSEAVQELFREEGGRFYRIDVNEKQQKKLLAEAGKIVKANRGVVRIANLLLIGLPAVAFTVFAVFFANPLMQRAFERGLESIFQADAYVQGFRLDVMSGSLSIELIAQADEGDRRRNFFVLEDVQVDIQTAALFHRSFVIQNLQAGALRWSEPRSSRQLAAADYEPDPVSSSADDHGSGVSVSSAQNIGLVLQSALSEQLPFGDLSPESLSSELTGGSQALSELDALTQRSAERVEYWSGRSEELTDSLEAVTETYQEVIATDVSSLNSVLRIREVADQVSQAISESEALVEDAREDITLLEQELNDIRRESTAIIEVAQKDAASVMDQLKSLGSGDASIDVEAVLEDVLVGLIGEKAQVFFRALEYYERVRNWNVGSWVTVGKTSRPGFRAGGVDVAFPSPEYPRFAIQRASFAFNDEGGFENSVLLEHLTSDPVDGDPPVSVEYRSGGRSDVFVMAEIANSGEQRPSYQVEMTIASESVSIDSGLEIRSLGFNLERASAIANIELQIIGAVASSAELDLHIEFNEVSIDTADSGAIANAVISGLENSNSLYVEMEAGIEPDSSLTNIDLDSNIASIVSGSMANYMHEQLELLESAMDQAIEEYLRELEVEADQVFQVYMEQMLEFHQLSELSTKYQSELIAYQEALAQKVQSPVQDAAANAVNNALEDMPSIPSLPGRN